MNGAGLSRAFFDVRPEERRTALSMCAYFFLVITSFWILKPLKKTLFIGHYVDSGFAFAGRVFEASEAELLAKVLNMGVAAVAAVVFALLSQRLRREQLAIAFTLFFVVCYGAFALALESPSGLAVWSFYLFGDLFSTLMVAAFWAFLNDSVTPDAAKRLYGLVGFGGVAGGVFGSTAVSALIRSLSVAHWLGVTALLALGILAAAWTASRGSAAGASEAAGARPPEATTTRGDAATPDAAATPGGAKTPEPARAGAFAGLGLVARSRYLLSIVAIVGLYELVSTVVDFQFTTSIVSFSESAAERNQAFATVYATTNWLSMLIQLFLTSFVMRRLGMRAALLVLPCSIALASIAFAARPSLVLGGALSVSDNAFSYSLNQSAKEALYVPTTTAEKYQAKAVIDMFVQRFAKALGVGVGLIASTSFGGPEGVRWLSLFVLPALGLWFQAATYAGRRFAALEAEDAGESEADRADLEPARG